MNNEDRKRFLEPSPYDTDNGELIGRDPRKIPADDWEHWDNEMLVGLRAIRAKCMDCAHDFSEVRKCVAVDCPLWPLRMGSQPKGYYEARERRSGTVDGS